MISRISCYHCRNGNLTIDQLAMFVACCRPIMLSLNSYFNCCRQTFGPGLFVIWVMVARRWRSRDKRPLQRRKGAAPIFQGECLRMWKLETEVSEMGSRPLPSQHVIPQENHLQRSREITNLHWRCLRTSLKSIESLQDAYMILTQLPWAHFIPEFQLPPVRTNYIDCEWDFSALHLLWSTTFLRQFFDSNSNFVCPACSKNKWSNSTCRSC